MSPEFSPRSNPQSAADLAAGEQPTCNHSADSVAAELVSILDQYLTDLNAGRSPNRQELMARHPALASQLEACLAGLEFIHGAETAAPGTTQRLGDFRIIREVGRGGMGAVFEAEQISLRRSVALKVLRFGAVSDPESIERFKREAETVAKLHHTNIVPIFNVGSERGVNYYAMQFIEGKSLAQVLATNAGPVSPSQVAEWGLQAAEALDHAHQRGVIHRDVKPSNLLLDGENRLWLTDFGLARRMEDVTLSITGAILGTPRYMSPEQAAAIHKQVDHRSDLFSLGATLYELLTAEPAFGGNTPHDVIQHILNTEPKPISQLLKSVPRDLETIVTKCLAKESSRRYDTARDLADDLRACLDGRPIRARRASWAERGTRWVKRQQKNVKLAATAAALTLVATFGVLSAYYGYDAWRQAAIKLDATTPPLMVELLNSDDQLVRVDTAPMQNPINLPTDDYQLRMATDGTLSQTLDVNLRRGRQADFMLDLQDQLLWPQRDVERAFEIVDFGGEQGIVFLNDKGIGLQKFSQPRGWTIDLKSELLPVPDKVDGFRWPWNTASQHRSGYGHYNVGPWLAPSTVDLDGRGVGDLILAGRHQAWLMAVSGDDGKILWFAGRGHDVSQPTTKEEPGLRQGIQSAVLGEPICNVDCNADGTLDVIATLVDLGTHALLNGDRYLAKCWVEAISGKTGETLWSYEIPSQCFDLPAGESVPYDLRWFAGPSGGSMASGGGSMKLGRHRIRSQGRIERTGPHAYRPASVSMISVMGSRRLAIVAGADLLVLNPTSGEADSPPIGLSARPARGCHWQDLDGDGTSEVIMLERGHTSTGVSFGSRDTVRLTVWSPTQRDKLWEKKLDAFWPSQPTWTSERPAWPLVVDMDGDSKFEIIVPDRNSASITKGIVGSSDVPWGSVAVLAGDSGKSIWNRRLVSIDQQVDHFVAGPDLDQDGVRELFTVTLVGSDFHVYVDALSGQTGNTLWSNHFAIPPNSNSSAEYQLNPPRWWQAGADGWPQLIVQVLEGNLGDRETHLGLFSAGTGKLTRRGHNVTAVHPADLDDDGIQDLLVHNSRTPTALDLGGNLHCIRGVAGENWAQLGNAGDPISDFDNDGTQDLLRGFPERELTATSGATGEILWKSAIHNDGREYWVRAADSGQAAQGDLNGDGIVDLLGWSAIGNGQRRFAPFFALSGKTGEQLWAAADVSVQMLRSVCAAEAHDLDGDGKSEILWLAALDYGYPLRRGISSHETQLWLLVASGQTGKLRWSHPLSPAYGQAPGSVMQCDVDAHVPLSVGDLNGDGTQDIIVPEVLPDGNGMQTVALSGKDGSGLWVRPFPVSARQRLSLSSWVPPTIDDLNGDGNMDVVMVEISTSDDTTPSVPPRYRVTYADGYTGSDIWSWESRTMSDAWQPPLGQTKGELMRPRLLRTGRVDRCVAVMLPGVEAAVVVFDVTGKAHEFSTNNLALASGIWPIDCDLDGVDELAFLGDSELRVAPMQQLDRPLWTKSLEAHGQHRILGILARAGQPPVLAVARGASDNSVVGFDSANGQPVWHCPGPISRDANAGVYFLPRQLTLLDASAERTPLVYYNYGQVSRCRRAIPTAAAKLKSSSTLPPAINSLAIEIDSSHAFGNRAYSAHRDDRWARDLPWVKRRATVSDILTMVVWSLVFALFMVVLPIACLFQLFTVRSYSLGKLMLVPAITGLFLAACLVEAPTEQDMDGLAGRLLAGLAFSPVILATGVVLDWLARARWRRLLLWFVMTWVASGICASIFLWTAAQQNPQIPEVHYDPAGWYLILLLGLYLASWALSLDLAVRTLRRLRRGGRGKPPDASELDATLAAKMTASH